LPIHQRIVRLEVKLKRDSYQKVFLLLKPETMNKRKLYLLFVLSVWISLLYLAVSSVVPKRNFLFHFRQIIIPSSPQIERTLRLKPDSYLLKIKHEVEKGQTKYVTFNGRVLTPFKVLSKDIKAGPTARRAKVTDYFYLHPSWIQRDNRLEISFTQSTPKEVTIKLWNYRHSPFRSGLVVILFRTARGNLLKLVPLHLAIVFVSSLLFLGAVFFLTDEKTTEVTVRLVFVLNIPLTIAAVYNVLPFTRYLIYVDFFTFWLWPGLVLFLFAAFRLYQNTRWDVVEEYIGDDGTLSMTWPTPVVFCFLLLILAVLRFLLVLDKRVPMGHDTFQYLQLQYNLFFNEPALYGRVPQWLPFMTHGTISNIWVAISQGIVVSVLVPFAKLLKHINFLYIFNLGLLFDELVLLLGCVLLARRLFRSSAAILFVASSIVFTTISSTQIWYDFHLVYLLPLTLYCFGRALQRSSAMYLFLALLLFVGMSLGNLPYFPPLLAFIISVFGLAFCVYMPSKTLHVVKNFIARFSWRHVIAIVIPAFLVVCLLLLLKTGAQDITLHNKGRSMQGTVESLGAFLNYGGYTGLQKYLEFIGRGSNNIDNTIYAGLLVVPFAVLALLRVRSRLSYVFGTTALVAMLFSAGIVIPVIFYYCFPLGKYYRHIGLAAPLAKLFVVFYAGFGFELFWQSLERLRKCSTKGLLLREKADLLIPCVILLCAFILALVERTGISSVFDFSPWSVITMNQLYLDRSQICSLMTLLLLLSGVFIALLLAAIRWPKLATVVGLTFIAIHLVDVVSFKVESEFMRVPRVNKDVQDLFYTYKYSFAEQRSQDYFRNKRFSCLVPFIFYENNIPLDTTTAFSTVGKYGALYWNMGTFIFFDAVSSIFRSDHWLTPIDSFYKVWVPAIRHLGFPIPSSLAFRKLCGYGFPKLQAFSRIHILPNENDIAEVLARPSFQGDAIMATSDQMDNAMSGPHEVPRSTNEIVADSNDRLDSVSVFVKRFTFDDLELTVVNNSGKHALLYYADAWHPRWKAYVDGMRVAVIKTNIGYKSIVVPPGESEVAFRFGDSFNRLLFTVAIGAGICIFCAVVYLLLTELHK